MITSKEALEQIMEKYIFYVPARSEGKEHLINCLNIIAKDLGRLETLEKEYNNLKKDYDNKDLEWCDLLKENAKLKQALDIIKIKKINVLELKFSYSVIEYNIMARNSDFDELTQEEYELLKEVLGNDTNKSEK